MTGDSYKPFYENYFQFMKTIKEEHRRIVNILSFSLIPLAGFATDIYLPSLPSMTISLHASASQIQLSLLLFMASAGVSQLFVGSLLDSFGRYRLSNSALFIFSIASFLIGLFPDLHVLYLMRIVQGVAASFVLVARRAYFMDTYSGDQLKRYTSLFSIIWATAPIIAPFLGGYLQKAFGWQSSFYMLGILPLVILVLTIKYGGESAKDLQPLRVKPLLGVYSSLLTTKDFALALVILGLNYGMVLLFGMASPFIIEHQWHQTPVVTGYCALVSGVAMMAGGIISRSMLRIPLEKKLPIALGVQLTSGAFAIIISMSGLTNIYVMMSFVILQHGVAGFVFNNLFAYSLGRFSRNAGIVAGMTGGASYIISSFSSYGTASFFAVTNQTMLALGYLFLNLCVVITYSFFRKEEMATVKKLRYGLS
ncbi:MAG TPA: MFS transporter [Chitinophagaceae bacterium]|nr:MFS transporter [Chitinophagaceae bacterium]